MAKELDHFPEYLEIVSEWKLLKAHVPRGLSKFTRFLVMPDTVLEVTRYVNSFNTNIWKGSYSYPYFTESEGRSLTFLHYIAGNTKLRLGHAVFFSNTAS